VLNLLKESVARADALQQRHVWLAFPVAVLRKASDDQVGSLAALMAYFGFLAIVPLLLVFAATLGFILASDPSLKAQVLQTAEGSLPSLAGYISHAIRGSNTALGVGSAGALWAGLGVTRATERAMDSIWDIPLHERPNLWWSRVRGLGMLVVLGGTFLGSTALASLRGVSGIFGVATDVVAVVGSLALNLILYALAFQVLTNRHLPWRAILPGATVGATAWALLQNLGSLYVRHEVAHASQLYGSLAVVIGLLAWIYLGARLTLYAAELNVVLKYRLWPRSLGKGVTTPADRLAYRLQAREAQRVASEEIDVTFATPDSQGRHASAGPTPR
jgi:membrane protein